VREALFAGLSANAVERVVSESALWLAAATTNVPGLLTEDAYVEFPE
jgi:hypothetical protein